MNTSDLALSCEFCKLCAELDGAKSAQNVLIFSVLTAELNINSSNTAKEYGSAIPGSGRAHVLLFPCTPQQSSPGNLLMDAGSPPPHPHPRAD